MASYQYLQPSGQVRTGTCLSTITHGHGYSKAQFSLMKILHTISTNPPEVSRLDTRVNSSTGNSSQIDAVHDSQSFANHRAATDLNLSLGPSSEVVVGESESFAENEPDSPLVGNGRKDTGSDIAVLQQQVQVVGDKSVDVSEVTNPQKQQVQARNFEVDPLDVEEEGHIKVKQNEGNGDHDDDDINDREKAVSSTSNKPRSERNFGFDSGVGIGSGTNHGFDLLVEAARLISGTIGELESEDTFTERELGGSTRARTTAATGDCEGESRLTVMNEDSRESPRRNMSHFCFDFEVHSPVVRSKRGRTQTLPYRYRDSVLEPLKRSGYSRPPPQRLSSTTVSRKRLSRS